jgi:hypothetical protein
MYKKYTALWVSQDITNDPSKVFKDRKSDHIIAKEKQEVHLDREMHGIISKY